MKVLLDVCTPVQANHRPTLEQHWPLIGKTASAMQPSQYLALKAPVGV
jgi:hypothetical protein